MLHDQRSSIWLNVDPFLFILCDENEGNFGAIFLGLNFHQLFHHALNAKMRRRDQALNALNARYILELMYRVPSSFRRPGFFPTGTQFDEKLSESLQPSLFD